MRGCRSSALWFLSPRVRLGMENRFACTLCISGLRTRMRYRCCIVILGLGALWRCSVSSMSLHIRLGRGNWLFMLCVRVYRVLGLVMRVRILSLGSMGLRRCLLGLCGGWGTRSGLFAGVDGRLVFGACVDFVLIRLGVSVLRER